MGILTDKASIFCLVVLHIILTLFDLRKNSLSVDLTASWNTPSAPYRGASAKGEATKAVPFWLDKASIGG